MNRKLLVTLLQKNIQELELITQGFMEMTEYPMPIILLAQRKTEDIQLYIKELSVLKEEVVVAAEIETVQMEQEKYLVDEIVVTDKIEETEIDELLEIEEIVEEDEVKADDIEIDAVIIDTPQPVAEVTVSEEVVLEEVIVEEPITEEKIKILENLETVQEEIQQSTIVITEETRKTILGERATLTTPTRNELLSRVDNSISSTLANKKITDIKQAINIGDRFRFQRELFRSNGEDMNKTLTYINQLATLEEVMSFLKSKYGWTAENEASEDFYQIVRRRFV
ncbi:MAG: hypothetical protein WCG93_02655 [Paludibacter sp.]